MGRGFTWTSRITVRPRRVANVSGGRRRSNSNRGYQFINRSAYRVSENKGDRYIQGCSGGGGGGGSGADHDIGLTPCSRVS